MEKWQAFLLAPLKYHSFALNALEALIKEEKRILIRLMA